MRRKEKLSEVAAAAAAAATHIAAFRTKRTKYRKRQKQVQLRVYLCILFIHHIEFSTYTARTHNIFLHLNEMAQTSK